MFFTPRAKDFGRQSTKIHSQQRADQKPKMAAFRHVFDCSVEPASQEESKIDTNESTKQAPPSHAAKNITKVPNHQDSPKL